MKKLLFILSIITLFFACSSEDSLLETSGSNNGQSGSITRFATHNGYMYALNPNEVITYDLSNPENPTLTNTLETDYGLETIFIYDNTIYLGSTQGLYILGIDNPAVPELLSQTTRDNLFIGGCDPVVVKDNYAYSTVKIIENICGIANSFSALIVYDVSILENPQEVGTYALNEPNGLAIKDNYLFICDAGSNEVLLFDISQPTDLQQLTDLSIPSNQPFDIIVNGNSMIVSQKTQFEIFDVSDIYDITEIGTISK